MKADQFLYEVVFLIREMKLSEKLKKKLKQKKIKTNVIKYFTAFKNKKKLIPNKNNKYRYVCI